jgi:hypothetical protein
MIRGLLLLAFCMNSLHAQDSQAKKSQLHIVRVYIHGTCYSELSLLNPQALRDDCFDGTTAYETVLKKCRTDGFMERSDLILEPGFHEITDKIGASGGSPHQRAPVHIVNAFDAMVQARNEYAEAHSHYYIFGWMGLMSEKCRNESSAVLYQHLRELRDTLTKNGDTVQFELYAHSHGGQLALYLAHVRELEGDVDFEIERVVLSGTPLYEAKARYAFSGMFKVVLNMYSENDLIQRGDQISVPNKSCCNTFKDVEGLPFTHLDKDGPLVADVRLLVNQNKNIFGHGSFTILDRYTVFATSRKEAQTIRQIIDHVSPLPLIVLYPHLVPNIIDYMKENRPYGYHHLDVNFVQDNDVFVAEIYPFDGPRGLCKLVEFPLERLHSMRDQTKEAYAKLGYTSELRKTLHNLIYVAEIPAEKMRSFLVTINGVCRKYVSRLRHLAP